MTETIKSIEEVEGYIDDNGGWDGYLVETSERKIRLLVDNGASCCENWGMVASEDDLGYFLGAELLRIDWTGPDLVKLVDVDPYDGDVMFVDFVTSVGVLQLAVYNAHNGYYGHYAKLVIDGEAVHEDTI